MEKKLNVGERIILLQILTKEGNFATLRIVRDLASKIGLSADDWTEFGIVQEDGKVTWNEKGKEEVSIDFKQKEIEIITKELKEMDKESKLEFRHFSVFEKFAGEEDAHI